MYEKVIPSPAYGPQGQPLCVILTPPHGEDEVAWYWTAQDALDARDMLLDATVGCSVRICGLPTVIAGGDGLDMDDAIDGRN